MLKTKTKKLLYGNLLINMIISILLLKGKPLFHYLYQKNKF